MKVGYFTERPYRHVKEDNVLQNKAFFGLPNEQFDSERAADDYNYYLDEYLYAEELGYDALALNEHHGNPFCMGNVMNVEASILARITTKPKIVLIGNPLPVIKHPLRMAEELATIDLISRGRLITGWVRGAGSEQFFNNANPAYNREMFNEAHDFIIDAWTKPGPWRYEGKHFHYRHVNPWALPYQKPHPKMWIPGVLSPETVIWCAEHGYPYIGLGTALSSTADLWDIYADHAQRNGYQAGPENFGYLIPMFVAETEEKAQELGKGFVFGGGQNAFSAPQYSLPPGYNSKDAIRRLSRSPGGSWLGVSKDKLMGQVKDSKDDPDVDYDVVRQKLARGFQKAQANYQTLVGTPDQVVKQVKEILSVIRPGIFITFAVQGPVGDEARRTSMRLIGEEIMPEIHEFAKREELFDEFQRDSMSRPLAEGVSRDAVVDRDALNAINFDFA